jgi:nitrite reductase (NADH) large subunit
MSGLKQLVVIGNGMAGVAFVEQLLKHRPRYGITIFGDETHVNYNRILLSSVLAGEKSIDEIELNGFEWYQKHGIRLHLGVRIVKIDPQGKTVEGEDGSRTRFDKLVIATGSSAVIPPIPGCRKDGVSVFRTLDDARWMMQRAAPGVRAIVIGGGLLGLEAARGLQLRGADVTVLHLAAGLMERQLDLTAGAYLRAKIEALGIRVLTSCATKEICGDRRVEAVRLETGELLAADMVVIAAGIRPNAEIAKQAGLAVNRGIIVDDRMRTSHPDIYAVGECVEYDGQTFGLVAPLIEQGKVLASVLAGNAEVAFRTSITAAKLKIMGVDVFSAGLTEAKAGCEEVRFEDPALGIYKKLVLKNNRLAGVILAGDASDSHRYMEWLREGTDLTAKRRQLLFPDPAADHGASIAQMPDSETVCGCMGVTKGAIIAAIHERGICTMSQLKESTRASTGCGSCSHACESLLKAVAPGFEDEGKKTICKCFPFSYDQLRDIARSQQLRSVQQIIEIYGNGQGCEICKPALSYMVDMLWCGEHEEDRSARFINDRVHANIQNDGSFSVVPRIRGGVTSPAELRRIADVAEKYNVRMVKITGSQRIDLLGVKKADLPKIWADLGMPSGQAYTKGVRMVKTCVGTTFCRFGTQDSIAAGVELERRLENLFTPHKLKMAAVGCPRNCAEATVKDIGLVGNEGSWQVVVGGAAGKTVRRADLLVTVETTQQAIEAAELFFQYYRENANYLERTYDFVERLGIEKIRRDTVYAPENVRRAILDRLRKSKAIARDAWLERDEPAHPTQFIQIEPMPQPLPAAAQ